MAAVTTATRRIDGRKIREARLGAGMSQSQLARAVPTSDRNVVRWENDQAQPRVESVVAIAKATGRELEFFLTSSAEADEEERAASVAEALDDVLRLRIREILHEETSRSVPA